MSASSLITTLIALLVLLAAVPGLVPAQPAYGDPDDLNWCQNQCRDKFGVWWGRGTDTYYAYAQCIDDCNKAFWKGFDRKAKELEKRR